MIFTPMPKLPRLYRDCTITEKIDGTNASITIVDCGPFEQRPGAVAYEPAARWAMFAGSRSRFITPQDDNAGFARWVEANSAQLWALGEGTHFGEWWGQGIQRTYGLKEKRFSLFNAGRWVKENMPGCVEIVPILYQGVFTESAVAEALAELRHLGSVAAPGFMSPEGIVVYHGASRTSFKVTLDGDGHKGAK